MNGIEFVIYSAALAGFIAVLAYGAGFLHGRHGFAARYRVSVTPTRRSTFRLVVGGRP